MPVKENRCLNRLPSRTRRRPPSRAAMAQCARDRRGKFRQCGLVNDGLRIIEKVVSRERINSSRGQGKISHSVAGNFFRVPVGTEIRIEER